MISIILMTLLWATQPPSPDVCLTNACSVPPSGKPIIYPRDEVAVAAALKAGQASNLIRAGGTPQELGAMLRTQCAGVWPVPCNYLPVAGTEKFLRDSAGEITMSGAVDPSNEYLIKRGRAPRVRTPDMVGLLAPASVTEAAPNLGTRLLLNAK